MYSGADTLVDGAITRGMNNVDHPSTLQNGECELLVNAFPSNPPKPRRGCNFIFENTYGIPLNVAKHLTNDDTDVLLYLTFITDDEIENWYSIVSKSADNVSRTTIKYLKFESEPFFNMVAAHNSMYLIMDKDPQLWLTGTGEFSSDAPNHKVVEYNGITVRDMCISVPGYVSVFEQETVVYDALTIDKHYGYQFTYVRRSDAAAFTAGTPIPELITGTTYPIPVLMTTYMPGSVEGVAVAAYRTVKLTDTKNAIMLHRDSCSSHIPAMRQGATHIRVFRSFGQDSEEDALGATKYWAMDIPIAGGTGTYLDDVSDASLGGEVNTCFMDKYTVAPKAKFAVFHKGRMWLYGITGNEGFAMYSEIAGGDNCTDLELAIRYPQKYASMFKPTEYYIDCDHNDNLVDTGIARLNDDLYFFKESKIYALFGGDPTVATVECISESVGCAFPRTITVCEIKGVYGECILFMSLKGPYVIKAGGELLPVTQFKIKELWPEHSMELFNNYRDNYLESFKVCTGDFYANTWWLFCRALTTESTDPSKIYGLYFHSDIATDSSAPVGAMTLEFDNEVNVTPKVLAVKNSNEALLLCTTRYNEDPEYVERPAYCDFLSNKNSAGDPIFVDNVLRQLYEPDEIDSYRYNFKLLSRRLYIGPSSESIAALFGLIVQCYSVDDDAVTAYNLIVKVVSDYLRHNEAVTYNSGEVINNCNAVTPFDTIRHNIQVFARDGIYGSFFQYYINKQLPLKGIFQILSAKLLTVATDLDVESLAGFGAVSNGGITL